MQEAEYKRMFSLEDSHFWFVGKRLFIDAVLASQRGAFPKILDVGSGTGGATKHLSKYGAVLGIEPNRKARQMAQSRGLKILAGTAENLPVGVKQFDLVTCLDVLYHQNVEKVEQVVLEFRRVLKPRGLLLITDSAFEFLRSRHDLSMHTARRFTRGQLTSLLESSGFKVRKASYLYLSLFIIVLLRRLFTKSSHGTVSDVKEVPRFINLGLIWVLKLEAKLLRHFNFPFGSSVMILAEKK